MPTVARSEAYDEVCRVFDIEPADAAGAMGVRLDTGGAVARLLLELGTKRRHNVARCIEDILFATVAILLNIAQDLAHTQS